jgi:hypothetical protein
MQLDLLARVVAALKTAGIPYMVTGSVASTFHGEPRMTRDIDFVIDPQPRTIEIFVDQFERAEFYIDDAVAATRRRDMFNIIEVRTGWKVDLILRKERPFSLVEFSRRQLADIGGIQIFVSTAEDSILSKLEWSKESASEQQLRDVVMMLVANRDTVDHDYLQRWSTELGVEAQLRRACNQAASISET